QEAERLLANAGTSFAGLREGVVDPAQMEPIYRLAHNFKSGAVVVGFAELGGLAQVFEGLIKKVKAGEIPLSESVIEIFRSCEKALADALFLLRNDPMARVELGPVRAKVESLVGGKS
ncbi:MAG: Hpt domain-containing protein, partial [Bdellovibrionota bacterium]